MLKTAELEIPDIPFAPDVNEILERSAEIAGHHRITTSHIASVLVEKGREVPGDPFYGYPEMVAERLRKRGDGMVRHEHKVPGVKLMPLAQDVTDIAKLFAAEKESPAVTGWHLGCVIAAEEILMSKQGMDLIGAAGIKPDELADRFNGETDDPILLGTIIF